MTICPPTTCTRPYPKGRCDDCGKDLHGVRHWCWYGNPLVTLCLPCFRFGCKGFVRDLEVAGELLESEVKQDDYSDSVPDLADLIGEPAAELDQLAAEVSILEVYDKLLGLKRDESNGRTEGIMAICPLHPRETKPSAWFNLDKQVVCCGHDFTGLNKFGLYCHVLGLENIPSNFLRIKQLFVYQFRGADPYGLFKSSHDE